MAWHRVLVPVNSKEDDAEYIVQALAQRYPFSSSPLDGPTHYLETKERHDISDKEIVDWVTVDDKAWEVLVILNDFLYFEDFPSLRSVINAHQFWAIWHCHT